MRLMSDPSGEMFVIEQFGFRGLRPPCVLLFHFWGRPQATCTIYGAPSSLSHCAVVDCGVCNAQVENLYVHIYINIVEYLLFIPCITNQHPSTRVPPPPGAYF